MIKLRKFTISYERGRQLLLFLFCLFLAFIIWSIHKLSEEYTVYLKYKVSVASDLTARAAEAQAEETLIVRGKSTGFYILQHRYSGEQNSVKLSVERRLFRKSRSVQDGFYLLTSDIRDKIILYLGENVNVESFATDTLSFIFPGQTNKRVPVSSRAVLSFAPQYMAAAPVKLSPDTVTIYGERAILATIDSVITMPIKLDNLSAGSQGVAELKPNEGVRYSHNEVLYSVDVTRYVERSTILAVEVTEAPQGITVKVQPDVVTVYYREKFGTSPGMSDKMMLYIPYAEIAKSLNGVLKPILNTNEVNVLSYRTEPAFVEVKAAGDSIK